MKPRIYRKNAIEDDSSVTGDADPTSVLLSDFVLPSDESTQRALSINLDSLSLSKVKDSGLNMPGQGPTATLGDLDQAAPIHTWAAVMNYTLDTEREEQKEINIPLRYDVQFVTAHPCAFRQQTETVWSSTSPLSQIPGRSVSGIQTGWLLMF